MFAMFKTSLFWIQVAVFAAACTFVGTMAYTAGFKSATKAAAVDTEKAVKAAVDQFVAREKASEAIGRVSTERLKLELAPIRVENVLAVEIVRNAYRAPENAHLASCVAPDVVRDSVAEARDRAAASTAKSRLR